MSQKTCSSCRVIKDLESFVKKRSSKDGRTVQCKECVNAKTRERRKKNPTQWEIQKNRNFKKWREKIGVSVDVKPRRRLNGEGYISRDGYISYKLNGHPCADKNGRVQGSHKVWYEKTGHIPKKKIEHIHHKNGDTLDNRFENLELWTKDHPPGQRVEDKIPWAIEFLRQHGYEVIKNVK